MLKRLFLQLLILILTLSYTGGRISKSEKIEKNHLSLNTISPTPSIIIDIEIITETPIPSLTPKPSPTFTPTPVPLSSLEDLFEKYSRKQSFNKEMLKKVAYCESGYRADARNGIYGGLFQFSESTWRTTRQDMNQNPDINLRFNPEEAIRTAAFKMATQGIYAWPNCSK